MHILQKNPTIKKTSETSKNTKLNTLSAIQKYTLISPFYSREDIQKHHFNHHNDFKKHFYRLFGSPPN